MNEFQEFLDHEDKHVRFVAGLVRDAAVEFKAGNMTQDEYVEIVGDMVDTIGIDDLADTVERKNMYRSVFETLKEIASGIPL